MARPRKYTLNENYFNKIFSSNQSYILGFIYADGSVNTNRGSLDICISKKDESILQFIKEELKYSGEIKTKIINNNEYSILSIFSKKLIGDLNKIGIIQNKTFESKMLPIVPEHLVNDLLRGFFDGDGSIHKKGNTGYAVSFSSNISILQIIKSYLEKMSIKSSNIRLRDKNSIYSGILEICGNNQILKLFDLLYNKNENFRLKIKYDKFLDFKQYISNLSKRNISKEIIDEIEKLYILKTSQKNIHILLNIPYSSVRTIIRKLRKENKIV